MSDYRHFIIKALILLVCCISLSSSSSCDPAYNMLASLSKVDQSTARSYIYTSPRSADSGSVCGIQSSCCSYSAETYFKDDIGSYYQSSLFTALNTTLNNSCVGTKSLEDITLAYIDSSKTVLLQGFRAIIHNQNIYEKHKDLFNPFFSYVKTGISQLNISNLLTEFQKLYFATYTVIFAEGIANQGRSVPTSTEFNNCFYSYFVSGQTGVVWTEYNRFSIRYNLFFKYLRALKTAQKVLTTVVGHTLSDKCKLELLRMTRCSLCAGHNNLQPCPNFCSNVVRGCLVDLKEFSDVYNEFHTTLQETKTTLETYDPFDSFNILQTKILNFALAVSANITNMRQDLTTRCSVSFPSRWGRRKRNTKDTFINIRHTREVSAIIHHRRVRRQSYDAAKAVLQQTVTCSQSVSTLLNGLLSNFCNSSVVSTSKCNCWNGTHSKQYRYAVPNGDRQSQKSNPEIYLTSNTGLLYKDQIAQLKNVSNVMDSCRQSITTCKVDLFYTPLPSSTDYNLATLTRYNTFVLQTSGYPVVTSTSGLNCGTATSNVISSSSITETEIGKTSIPAVILSSSSSSTVISTSSSPIRVQPSSSSSSSSTITSPSSSRLISSSKITPSIKLPSITPPPNPFTTTTTTTKTSTSNNFINPTVTPGRVGVGEIPDKDKLKSGASSITVSLCSLLFVFLTFVFALYI